MRLGAYSVAATFVLGVYVPLSAAEISRVLVRQLWPWSTDVRVEYELTGVTEPMDVIVEAYNGMERLGDGDLSRAICGEISGIDSSRTCVFTLDPIRAFGKKELSYNDFRLVLTPVAARPDGDEILYKIFDLDTGSCTDVTRTDILNGLYGDYETDFTVFGPGFNTTLRNVLVWTGVTNNPAYKTSKLVMRKIPAAGKTWRCGSIDGTTLSSALWNRSVPTYHVRLTNDYYLAVFETTQAQWNRIYGTTWGNPSGYTESDRDVHPIENVRYDRVIGPDRANQGLTPGVHTGSYFYWPMGDYLYEVGGNSFMQALQQKTGVEFYLPTQAQWEYACRAGTETSLNCGASLQVGYINLVAWTTLTSDHTREVGLKAPNAFGLYDMHGNVAEMTPCSGDMASGQPGCGDSVDNPLIEPIGTLSTSFDTSRKHNRCGGHFGNDSWYGNHLDIASWAWSGMGGQMNASVSAGFRLACPVGRKWGE